MAAIPVWWCTRTVRRPARWQQENILKINNTNTFSNFFSSWTDSKDTIIFFFLSDRWLDISPPVLVSCQRFSLFCFYLITFQMSREKNEAKLRTHSLKNTTKYKWIRRFKARHKVLPWSFICLLPSLNGSSSMGILGSMLTTDTLVDSHNMLRELKLSNFLPCWSKAAKSKMGLR